MNVMTAVRTSESLDEARSTVAHSSAPENLRLWGSLHPDSPFAYAMTGSASSGLGGAAAEVDILEQAEQADLIAADWLLGALHVPVKETSFEVADLLADALAELGDVVQEAREEGFETPSEETVGVTERLLRAMYGLRRCRFEVYPTHDGDVAISAPGGHGRSVLVVCDSEGGVLCSVNMNGQHRRAVYDSRSATALPDGFVQEALAALDA
jgi:hypothetical protein